jgi:hypothetical protein
MKIAATGKEKNKEHVKNLNMWNAFTIILRK